MDEQSKAVEGSTGIKDSTGIKEHFKIIRNYYGLSQAEFAEKIHMSPGFILNVETGKSKISEKTVNAVCDAFPINMRWLLTGVNSRSGSCGNGSC